LVPATLAASCAFMLPVATPPNAIVYGSGYISIPQMSRAGIWMNLSLILLVTGLAYTLLLATFGIEIGVVPTWAQ
jgi:sodium-dependent dicarboxylate transporter 2/3/5